MQPTLRTMRSRFTISMALLCATTFCKPISAQTLPHHGTAGSSSVLWWITQTGLGGAGEYQINNASNGSPALLAATNGSGPAIKATAGSGLAGDFSGKVSMTGFQLSTAPTAGYVLTSDASGNGAWKAAPKGTTYKAGAGLSLSSNVFSVASGGVVSSMLAAGAVTTAALANGAVTPSKLSWPFQENGSSSGALLFIANTGGGTGIYGQSSSSSGVAGSSTSGYGVYGQSNTNDGGHFVSTSFSGVAGISTSGDGVYGQSSSSSGVAGVSTSGYGAYGQSNTNEGGHFVSTSLSGVVGISTSGYGMYGYSTSGYGVYGESNTNDGADFFADNSGFGVYGQSNTNDGGHFVSKSLSGVAGFSTSGYGMYGESSSNDGGDFYADNNGYGVYGQSSSNSGVAGISTSGYGVYGYSTNNKAGYFDGNIQVTGSISAGAKDFKIDHPLDPANKYLVHSCIESADMKNLYDGVITTDANGDAVVTLPDWFEALNTDFRYQLTVIGQFAQAIVATKIHHSAFTIKTDKPNVEVSWQVTGIRQDAYAKAHPLEVEQDKPGDRKGKFLHPKELGYSDNMGEDYEYRQKSLHQHP